MNLEEFKTACEQLREHGLPRDEWFLHLNKAEAEMAKKSYPDFPDFEYGVPFVWRGINIEARERTIDFLHQ